MLRDHNKKEFLKAMTDFAYEAGAIALKFWGKRGARAGLKADKSIITLADKAVSRLARRRLAKFLAWPGHILIEEEDPKVARFLDKNILKRATHIWCVDPIDGTRNYANHIPSFGISIGLLKDLKPWIGVVYFPVLGELFFCDGRKAYIIENVGRKTEKKSVIKISAKKVDGKTYFLATDTFFKKFDWDHKGCRVMIQSCAVIEMCWPAVGRGCGGLIKSSLWDFAGAWPIIRAAGMELRALTTGKIMNRLNRDCFDPRLPWRLKDFYIISTSKNFSILKNKIQRKT